MFFFHRDDQHGMIMIRSSRENQHGNMKKMIPTESFNFWTWKNRETYDRSVDLHDLWLLYFRTHTQMVEKIPQKPRATEIEQANKGDVINNIQNGTFNIVK